MVLAVANWILLCIAGVFVLYLMLLSIFGCFAHRIKDFTPRNRRRFAVVVPAHDEEESIVRTVSSLLEMDYPRPLFDVVVVADNCTDLTASVARSLGAIVYERSEPDLRGKGYALRWVFDRLTVGASAYDAVVVIDADTIASRNFLTVMNHYLENGSQVVQCSDMAEPQPESWISEVIRFGFTLYNFARPMGKKVLRCSAGLKGNGMCFSRQLLQRHQWSSFSLNEDLEYGLHLLLDGIVVAFAPEAQVQAMMPAATKDAESQRSRWERGRFPVMRGYTPRLLAAAFRQRSLAPADALLELYVPPFVNLFGGILLMLGVNVVLSATGILDGWLAPALWACLAVAGVVHVLGGLLVARADRGLYKAILYIPRYAVWKILLYLKLAGRKREKEWIRTSRAGNETSSSSDDFRFLKDLRN